jgi:hypothetical protein
MPPGPRWLPPKICFDIENEARKTMAYILGGILAIIGIYMAHRRIRALERQVLVAQESQITERFTQAIEHLGSDKMEIRLGGIYALERIANDSDKDYWSIIETLTAYVRENAPWREPSSEGPAESIAEEAPPPDAATIPETVVSLKPATDIQAVLTVLSRRKYHYDQGETEVLNLGNTDLQGASLWEAHLEGAILREAHLEGAALWGVRLEEAVLIGAHLKEASLMSAHLERANLRSAHLEGADLMLAHLDNADLKEAHMDGSDLFEAHLEWADLGGTCLKGAILRNAKGLTREQLAEAIIDEKTILPNYLQEPPAAKGPEGNDGE